MNLMLDVRILILHLLLLLNCSSERMNVKQDSINYLFNVEGCKLYRLDDGMGRHYFTVCPNECKVRKNEPRIIPDMGYNPY